MHEPPDLPVPITAVDVVRVPHTVGLPTLDILGVRSGAVIDHDGFLHWFIPTGTASEWDVPGTRALAGREFRGPVPASGVTRGPGSHWRICPGQGRWTTSIEALAAALADATASAHRGSVIPLCQ